MEQLERILKEKINILNEKTKNKYDLSEETLNKLNFISPFNKIEYVISHLLATATLSLEEYHDIRSSYLRRNKYLYTYEITAPRTFGESWGQRHLSEVVPELKKPTTSADPNYKGQYDFWYKGIKIEVKSSRAVKKKSGDSLINKAISSESQEHFEMNFQQMKPACCDVFVWIGVWTDVIRYWVLSSDEVKNSRYYSNKQHRGNKDEGQLWVKDSNIDEFNKYEAKVENILNKIEERANLQ